MPKHGSQLYYASDHWQKLRITVLRRDRFKCKKCGTLCLGKKRNGVSPYIDHIKPRNALSGIPTILDVADNTQVLCGSCHNQKTAFEDNNEKPMIGADGFPIDSDW
jgi:5-methylcytosine-specific restriction endonuclease McrA